MTTIDHRVMCFEGSVGRSGHPINRFHYANQSAYYDQSDHELPHVSLLWLSTSGSHVRLTHSKPGVNGATEARKLFRQVDHSKNNILQCPLLALSRHGRVRCLLTQSGH